MALNGSMSALTANNALRDPIGVAQRRQSIRLSRGLFVGGIFGLADSAVALTYAFGVDVAAFYAVTLGLKLALILILRPSRTRMAPVNLGLLMVLLFGVSVGITRLGAAQFNVVAPLGFIVHIFLSGSFIGRSNVRQYLLAITCVTAAVILGYLASWALGDLPTLWGRYLYFGEASPNLGGEIIAACLFAAGIHLRGRSFLVLSTLALFPLILMQTRAALLAVVCMQAICFYFSVYRQSSLFSRSIMLGVALAAIGISWATLQDLISNVLLLADANRGFDTGFVGRDILWQAAANAFYDSPIIGQGLGYFESIGSVGAHNLFLFILAENGLIGLFIIGWILYGVFRFGFSRETLWFLPFFVLAAFNDRFVNLNPYPFLFYMFMWLPTEAIRVECLSPRIRRRSVQTNGVIHADVD